MKTFRLAKENELSIIAELFTKSFSKYPLFPILLKDKEGVQKHLSVLNEINTRVHYKRKACYVGISEGEIVAAVLMKRSDESEPNTIDYLMSGGLRLLSKIGISGVYSLLKTMEKVKAACNNFSEQYWYIDSFAVSKQHQGQSVGSQLFEKGVFPYIASNGGGTVTLVTHTDLNKKFYEKNGFQLFSQYPIEGGNKTVNNMSFKQYITENKHE